MLYTSQGLLGRGWSQQLKWPAPNRECHLPLNSVGNVSEPNVLAAAWGSQFQHLQSKAESLFPVARLVDTHALSSNSLT